MQKTLITLFSALLLNFNTSAQKQITQKIEGTELEFNLVSIPGGKFTMGNNNGKEDTQPEHSVEISPFYMSTHEVTWDLFEPFLYKDLELIKSSKVTPEVDAITRPTKPYLDMTFGMGKLGKPAVAMTQYNAIQFCKWLYHRTGVFYRLPTEAEWEYAAKLGFDQKDLENIDQYAWHAGNSENSTHTVGSKKPNKLGIYDLLGNVSEWTYDQYAPDTYSNRKNKTSKDPVVIPTTLYPHAVRGGSYLNETDDYVSVTARDYSDPSWKQIDPQIPKSNWWVPDAPFVGIRLVRPEVTPSKEIIEKYYNQSPIKDF